MASLTRKQDGMNDVLKSLSQQAKENIEKEKSLTDKFTRKQDGMNNVLKSLSQQAQQANENIKKEKNLTDEFKKRLKSEIDKTLVDLELNRNNFESELDWFAENNYFGFCREDERDPKKIGWTADEAVNKLFMDEARGIGSITIGALLMPLCPLLGIAIIATGVVPTPIKNALKKELQEDTLDMIPFEKIPSIRDKISEAAGNVKGNVDDRIKTFAKIMGDSIKEQKKIKIEEKNKKLNEKKNSQKKNLEEPYNIWSNDSKLGKENEEKKDTKKSWEEKEREREEEKISIKSPRQIVRC